jgi:hypothetical protein
MRISVGRMVEGTLEIDGDLVPITLGAKLPRAYRSCRVYMVEGTPWSAVENLIMQIGPGGLGTATRGRRRDRGTVTLAVSGGGVCKLLPASSWALSGTDTDELALSLAEVKASLDELGWSSRWPNSGSVVAARLRALLVPELNKRRNGATGPERSQGLRPRYRGIAHRALTTGPQLVLRGGAPPDSTVYGLDQRRAFLAALRCPVPLPGHLQTIPRCTPEFFRRAYSQGFALIDAYVHPGGPAIPPLPYRVETGLTVWPEGFVRACVPVWWVIEGESKGWLELRKVWGGVWWRWQDATAMHEPVADLMEEVLTDHPRLKSVYLTYWGRLASVGGFLGVHPYDAPKELQAEHFSRLVETALGEEKRGPADNLIWSWSGYGGLDYRAATDYRPDHAAVFGWHVSAGTIRAAAQCDRDSVLMAHVDSVWTFDKQGADRIEESDDVSWRVKDGPFPGADVRMFRAGAGKAGSKVWAAGWDPRKGPPTPEGIRAEGEAWGTMASRRWLGPGPMNSPTATSTPPWCPEQCIEPLSPYALLVTQDKLWTRGGWYRDQERGQQPEPAAPTEPSTPGAP